jgi:hypothetical protein
MTHAECRRRDAEIAALRRAGASFKALAETFGLAVSRISQICTLFGAKPWADKCRRGHPRTPENTMQSKPRPRCRPCHNENGRRYTRKAREARA